MLRGRLHEPEVALVERGLASRPRRKHSGSAGPQAWTYKKLGFPVPYLVVGRWGVTPFPAPTPLRFVVGEPLTALEPGAMVRGSSSVGSMRASRPRTPCPMAHVQAARLRHGNWLYAGRRAELVWPGTAAMCQQPASHHVLPEPRFALARAGR